MSERMPPAGLQNGVVPELALRDPVAGAEMLVRVFGFVPEGATLRCGSQRVRLVQGAPDGHGAMDHLALAVDDAAVALAALQARGAVLDAGVTPDGPRFIAEFWEAGVTYAYLRGPEGARIEICARPDRRVTAPGHDHLGLPCGDLSAMAAFWRGLGATDLAAVTLHRAGGAVPVRFMAFGDSVLELYAPPGRVNAAQAFWQRLWLPGSGPDLDGPEGLRLSFAG